MVYLSSQTNEERILEQRKRYMSNTFVLFEIIKALSHREMSLLTPSGYQPKRSIRYLVALNIDYLKKHLKIFQFDKYLINLYMSVARLKDIPVFSYRLTKRTNEDKYKEFNKDYEKYITGYNLFFDFDGKEDYDRCLSEVKEMKRILDEIRIPYFIMSSSFKGFHIHIPFEFLPDLPIDELLRVLNDIIYNIKGIHNFETLDTTIVDMKRLCKIPYSPVSDGSICLPLNDYQIDNFRKDMIGIDEVLRTIQIKNRGLLIRNHNLNVSQLKENTAKFITDYK